MPPRKGRGILNPDERAIAAARAADEKKADDVVVLDVGDMTPMTDYFVIASGQTATHIRAITDGVRQAVRGVGGGTPRREGDAGNHWVLLDYGDVVVHVFRQPEREYYDLERLWADARRVDWAASDAASDRTVTVEPGARGGEGGTD